jgi:uncharacterized OB-fold protein
MTTDTDYTKPLPRPEEPELTAPFWEAAQRGELVIPRCNFCADFFWYPREACPRCLRADWDWTPVSGKARLHTYTVVRQPAHPAFAADVPYAFAMIQLHEGVRMMSNVVGVDIPDGLEVNMPLEVVFDSITDDWTLIKFRPASA